MPKEYIHAVDGIPYLINEEAGTATMIDPNNTNLALAPQFAKSGDVVKKVSQRPTDVYPQLGLKGAEVSIPGMSDPFLPLRASVNSILAVPTEAKRYWNEGKGVPYPKIPGPSGNALSELIGKFVGPLMARDNGGLAKSIGNFEESPLKSGVDLQGAIEGAKGLMALPGAVRGGTGAIREALKNYTLGKKLGPVSEVPRWGIPELEAGLVDPGKNFKWAKRELKYTPSLPEVGINKQTAQQFGSTSTGREQLQTGAEKALKYATKQVDNTGVGKLWGDAIKQSTGESGTLNSDKFINWIKNNADSIKNTGGSDTAAAMQNLAYSLKKMQNPSLGATNMGAMDITDKGVEIAHRLATTALGKAIGGARALPYYAAEGATRALSLKFTNEQFAKLMLNPDTKWIMARLAGKKSTDPSILTDITKLAKSAGQMGIPVILNSGQNKHELNEE